MTMTTQTVHPTRTQLSHEDEVARLDNSDPKDWRPANHVRAVMDARDEVEAAEARLRKAVTDARDGGDSWVIIGAALGITRQAAQQRFDPRKKHSKPGVARRGRRTAV
jgi:hypothetical protein